METVTLASWLTSRCTLAGVIVTQFGSKPSRLTSKSATVSPPLEMEKTKVRVWPASMVYSGTTGLVTMASSTWSGGRTAKPEGGIRAVSLRVARDRLVPSSGICIIVLSGGGRFSTFSHSISVIR